MTREQAIEFGKMWLQINEDAKDSDTYNFFKFSIEALEQEPVLDKIFCIIHPLSIMSTPELEHKAIMQIAEMLEPLCLLESEVEE